MTPCEQGTEFKFAMKTLDKHEMAERNKVQRVLTEAQVLNIVDHPFLPTLYCTLQVCVVGPRRGAMHVHPP